MTKSLRRFVSQFAMLAVVFGQLSITAYACPVQGVAMPVAMTRSSSADDCAGMAPAATPPANACEVHCADATAAPASPDLPPFALTALPVSAIPLAALATTTEGSTTPHAALPGAPPLSLQFCRLLI